MNRKSKIIVSVVGITIVLLALLGITYAYYLTRIEGNTNTNSISVTTADLKLVYGDGNGLVTASDIMPGTVIEKDFTVTNSGKSKVEGYLVVLEGVTNELARKEDLVYTLTCKLQDETSCGTITETVYPSIPTSVIFTNDIDVDVTQYYTLTVTYKNLEDVDQSEDMGKTFSGRVNIMDANTNPYKTGVTATDNASLVYNIINNAMTNANGTIYSPTPLTTPSQKPTKPQEEYTIENIGSGTTTLVVGEVYGVSSSYRYDGYFEIDVENFHYTDDLTQLIGKYILHLRPCIEENAECEGATDSASTIYYINEKTTATTLSYDIIEAVAHEYAFEEELEIVLTMEQDSLGTSYYFRGAVQDNYVLFNNMCFRIVRIEGDGSVKLVFAGDVTEGATNCNEVGTATGVLQEQVIYGYDENFYADYVNYEGGLEDAIETWYSSKFTTDTLKGKLKTDKWCLRDNYEVIFENDGYGETFSNIIPINLACKDEEFVESKYGTLTINEVVYAGGTFGSESEFSELPTLNYYLNDNVNSNWWTLTVGNWQELDVDAEAFSIDNGYFIYLGLRGDVGSYKSVRPAITLIPGTTIVSDGDGTKTNPYIIN